MIVVPGDLAAPFRRETDKDDIVLVYDAEDQLVATFNTHTQISLDDEEGLAEELQMHEAFADFLVNALNTASESYAEFLEDTQGSVQ